MATKPTLTSETFQGKSAYAAKRKAIKNWRQKAQNQYGKKWSYWFRAKEKERICWGPAKKAMAYVKAKPYHK